MSARRQGRGTRLSTADIPQANRLENVRRLTAAVRDGIENPAALLELLDVDHRHFAYYRRAALILGVLQEGANGTLSVSAYGRALLATTEASQDERLEWRRILAAAPSLQRFADFFESLVPDHDALALRIASLTGLSGSTALRRAGTLLMWKRYLDGPPDPGQASPRLPDVSVQIEETVARHNALVKQQYLEWLMRMPPAEFEGLIARLVGAMGYSNVRVLGGSGDGGIDVVGDGVDQWGASTRVVVQVKRHRRTVGRRVIDELLGVLARDESAQGVLVTTADFSVQALDAGRGRARLRLVNGPQLVGLLVDHGVGLARGPYGDIRRAE